ncbi:MAG: DHH family phosphoesterase [Geobacter sp.]|nr:DHH family phosphoesterase [Geobacter sp.]
MDQTLKSIVEEIRKGSAFLIASHESPDGDAIGASLALANYLVGLGKEVAIHNPDPVPELYSFLPMADRFSPAIPDREFDAAFVLDIGEYRRTGKVFGEFKRYGKYINIDHHLMSDPFGAINLIDPKASATGALIHRIIKAAGDSIDYATALCIYTAVITDTGSFHYSNSDQEAFNVAGEMVMLGVDAWDVAERLYESQPRQRMELLALVLATLNISPRGDFASITVTLDMYDKSCATAELTDGFINYPRSIKGVEVAIFFRQLKADLYKVGFRSKGKVNVAALSAAFGGGGHHNAAGCTIAGSIDEVREKVFAHLEQVL